MLNFANLPLYFWVNAILTSCFTQNRSYINKKFLITPYEILNSRKPNVKLFHIFGSNCFLYNILDQKNKLKKVDKAFFLSYSLKIALSRKIRISSLINLERLLYPMDVCIHRMLEGVGFTYKWCSQQPYLIPLFVYFIINNQSFNILLILHLLLITFTSLMIMLVITIKISLLEVKITIKIIRS